jgi:hypothetical protein
MEGEFSMFIQIDIGLLFYIRMEYLTHNRNSNIETPTGQSLRCSAMSIMTNTTVYYGLL